jgi:hypothetical protein
MRPQRWMTGSRVAILLHKRVVRGITPPRYRLEVSRIDSLNAND